MYHCCERQRKGSWCTETHRHPTVLTFISVRRGVSCLRQVSIMQLNTLHLGTIQHKHTARRENTRFPLDAIQGTYRIDTNLTCVIYSGSRNRLGAVKKSKVYEGQFFFKNGICTLGCGRPNPAHHPITAGQDLSGPSCNRGRSQPVRRMEHDKDITKRNAMPPVLDVHSPLPARAQVLAGRACHRRRGFLLPHLPQPRPSTLPRR